MRFCVILLLAALCGLSQRSHAVTKVPGLPIGEMPDVLTVASDGFLPWGGFPVTVLNEFNQPVVGAIVALDFKSGSAPNTEGLVAWGVGQTHPVLGSVTDVNGQATFYVMGSGCISQESYQGDSPIVQVRADGVVIGEVAVNSPDAVNSAGLLPTDTNASRPNGGSNCEDGVSDVGISDAVFHTAAIAGGLEEFCSKFTEPFDEPVGLADAVIISSYVETGASFDCN